MSERFPISGPIDLRGQVAIVTGAARGIGRAIALALAREGAIVVVADVLPAEETVSEIHRRGGQAFAQNVDVTRDADVVALVEATVARYGRIDVLVNNAGVAARTGLEDTTLDLWQRDVGVILTGTFLVTRAVYPIMKRQGYGKIVNIASVSGKNGGAVSRRPDADDALSGRSGPAYAAAKGGVLAFTKWVAKDGGRYGIYCNAVCPGATRTELTRGFEYPVEDLPIARMGEPEDVAEAVVFLASRASNYITGQSINVDGGMVMD